jgi:hypothetical protein
MTAGPRVRREPAVRTFIDCVDFRGYASGRSNSPFLAPTRNASHSLCV